MTTIEWLSRAYKIEKQIQFKQEQIELWRNLANKLTASYQPSEGKSGSRFNRFEEYMVKALDAEAELEAELLEIVCIKAEIEYAISLLGNKNHRDIITQRYILGKEWKEIAVYLNFSEEYVRGKAHSKALKEISDFIGKI